jgi:LIM domain kinase 1
MSPEIINGQEFDLPTDVFSLGIIFIEILSRRLVDSRTFARKAPSFVPESAEVYRRATPGCPPELIALALECCVEEPALRPKMPDVLLRLREIERGVLARGEDGGEHVGSVKLVHGGKRGMPLFTPLQEKGGEGDEAEDEAKKMEEDALVALAGLDVGGHGAEGSGLDTWRTARWEEKSSILSHYSDASDIKGESTYDRPIYTLSNQLRLGHQRLLPSSDTSSSLESTPQSIPSYSTQVVKVPLQTASVLAPAIPPEEEASSTLTVKGAPSPPPTEESGRVTPSADTTPGPPVLAPTATKVSEVELKEAVKTTEPVQVLPTKKQKNDQEEAKDEQSGPSGLGLGTHRFTLVTKDGLGANIVSGAGAKKASTCQLGSPL